MSSKQPSRAPARRAARRRKPYLKPARVAAPRVSSERANVRVISHREFVGNIRTSLEFVTTRYAVNPGLPVSFPWLSTVAPSFERYRFRKLRYYFRTTSATAVASTNTALGVVGLVMNYDTADAAFFNKVQAESYEGAVSTVPCRDVSLSVDCRLSRGTVRNLFVRTAALAPAQGDLHLYDSGTLTVFTDGAQQSAVCGELWAEYEIELYQPRIPIPFGAEVEAFTAGNTLAAGFALSGAYAANPLSGMLVDGDSSLGVTVGTSPALATNSRLTFGAAGRYQITLRAWRPSASGSSCSIDLSRLGTVFALADGAVPVANAFMPQGTAYGENDVRNNMWRDAQVGTSFNMGAIIDVTAPGATVDFGPINASTDNVNPLSLLITIIQLPQNVSL